MAPLNYVIKDLKQHTWKSIWSGNWGLIDCFDWGDHYLKTLKVGEKVFLNRVVFLYKKDKSSAWVTEKDIDDFSQYLVKMVGSDLTKIKTIAKNLKTETDQALKFIKANKNNINEKNYPLYLKAIRKYYIAHVTVKYIVDSLPPDLLQSFLPTLQEARVYAEPVFAQTIEFDHHLAKTIAKKTKIKSELVLAASPQEVQNHFRTGKFPSKEELSLRHDFSALVFNPQQQLFKGEEAKAIEQALLPQDNLNFVKGTTAYPGQATGKVKIIFDPFKAGKFEKGDILITGMTRPEFLPLMEKAGAIVTDSGGVLCHAAITAREIKKPCIIGTQKATLTFKDGDIIEVDANKGIVRKIK